MLSANILNFEMLSVVMHNVNAECHYLSVIMLIVVKQKVIMVRIVIIPIAVALPMEPS
jgi:hypothetical protein